jgi:hypothetical protein
MYKKLIKIDLNEQKNHLPEQGVELMNLQIYQKQGELDLNAIITC